MPAVILKTSFVKDWNVGGYLDYMRRPRAFKGKLKPKTKELYDYFTYMGNDEKTDGLFDESCDYLSEKQIDRYRKMEYISLNEGCPKYIGVISFDNKFLQHNNWIVGNTLDIDKIKETARKAINRLIEADDMFTKENCYWTAAIHTNTDNVHVHFQLLEKHWLNDGRHKKNWDKLNNYGMEKLKSTVVQELLLKKHTPELTRIKRQILIPELTQNISMTSKLNTLMNRLPPTRKAWQYNRKGMKPYQAEINDCIDEIIAQNKELSTEFENYRALLEDVSAQYIDIYGERKREIADYAANQMEDFYQRAGNALLHELYDIRYGYKDSNLQAKSGAPFLLKEKSKLYYQARKLIEQPDVEAKDEIRRKQGLLQMNKLAESKQDDSQAAVIYLAYYFYKRRQENEKNRQNAKKFLERAVESDEKGYAAYSLGRMYIEDGEKQKAVSMLQESAGKGNGSAQYLLSEISKSTDGTNKKTPYNNNFDIKSYTSYTPRQAKMQLSHAVKTIALNVQITNAKCVNTIHKLLNESMAHLRRLQAEYEYEIERQVNNSYIPYEREY